MTKSSAVTPTREKAEFDVLYLTQKETKMPGVPTGILKLIEGDERTFYVRMGDTKGKWSKLPPSLVVDWKADPEIQVIKVSEEELTVKAIKAGIGLAMATTTQEGKKMESNAIMVEFKDGRKLEAVGVSPK